MESQEYRGRRVLVTGAASGIGEAAARLFAARGAAIAICDRDGVGASSVAAELTASGRRAVAVTADISNEREVERAVAQSVDALGGLDVVHANAAIFESFGTVLETTPEQWDRTHAINARGAFLTARAVLPHLVGAGGGVICFTGSDTTVLASADYGAYAASKHAVNGLVQSIAVDFGAAGVRANVVTPGVTDSPGLRSLYETGGRDAAQVVQDAAGWTLLGRVARPRDIAEAVLFLCSERASFITGANLVVDGGATIRYSATA